MSKDCSIGGWWCGELQGAVDGVQMQLAPVGVGWRPAAGMPDGGHGVGVVPNLHPDGGSVQDGGLVAAEEMIEELGLDPEALLRVIDGPFRPAVRVQPFVGRADAPETVEGSPGVQVVIGEAAADQRRYVDVLDGPVLRCPPFVEFGPPPGLSDEPGRAVGGDSDPGGKDGEKAVLPDAAGPGAVTVEVGEALPGADRRQVRWASGRCGPLADRQVGDSGHPDATVAPRLHPGPFDQVMAVQALLLGE